MICSIKILPLYIKIIIFYKLYTQNIKINKLKIANRGDFQFIYFYVLTHSFSCATWILGFIKIILFNLKRRLDHHHVLIINYIYYSDDIDILIYLLSNYL